MVSTMAYIMETVDALSRWVSWLYLEYFVSITFSLEFFLRLVACRNALRFWDMETWYLNNFMNMVDLLAVIPFYLRQLISGINPSFLKVVRIVRLLRVARLRRFRALQLN